MSDLKTKQLKNLIANSIKKIRTEKGLGQDELAFLISRTQGHISHYENGKSLPTIADLISICEALGCSMNYLLGRDTDNDLTTIKGRLIQAFDKLPYKTQLLVTCMIQAAAEVKEPIIQKKEEEEVDVKDVLSQMGQE